MDIGVLQPTTVSHTCHLNKGSYLVFDSHTETVSGTQINSLYVMCVCSIQLSYYESSRVSSLGFPNITRYKATSYRNLKHWLNTLISLHRTFYIHIIYISPFVWNEFITFFFDLTCADHFIFFTCKAAEVKLTYPTVKFHVT
jgi:hypothetical protein